MNLIFHSRNQMINDDEFFDLQLKHLDTHKLIPKGFIFSDTTKQDPSPSLPSVVVDI